MISKNNLLQGIKIGAASLVLLTAIGFAEKKHHAKVFEQAEVKINHRDGNFFVVEDDIMKLIKKEVSIGDHITAETMTRIESRLLDQDYIEEAQVYSDLKGKLMIEVSQCTPIARIVRPKDPDAYISSAGKILPVSDRFSARVLLITGDYADKMINAENQQKADIEPVKDLVQFIYRNPFWKAQIAQLDIDNQGDIVMYPQVGKQPIEFGFPRDIERKFFRLETFYKQILPKKGWNEYSRVSVKYKDQIICE